jgi:hypothetical protein
MPYSKSRWLACLLLRGPFFCRVALWFLMFLGNIPHYPGANYSPFVLPVTYSYLYVTPYHSGVLNA